MSILCKNSDILMKTAIRPYNLGKNLLGG